MCPTDTAAMSEKAEPPKPIRWSVNKIASKARLAWRSRPPRYGEGRGGIQNRRPVACTRCRGNDVNAGPRPVVAPLIYWSNGE
jgi:hypothetical protein